MTENDQILLIDDDEGSSHNLGTVLAFLGESIMTSNSTAWENQVEESGLKSSQFSAAIVANCRGKGLTFLIQELHTWEGGLPFILVGEHHRPEELDLKLRSAITAQLPAQLSYQPLLDSLHKAKNFHEHFNRLRDFDGVRDFNMFRSLVGESEALQKVRYMMGQVASKEVSVLITGESGTGKEVVARNLHLSSNRSDKPFIPINCGAIPRELLESELFGHEKGAFTGAIASRAGRFELADGGTLFLDEIGDMPLSMQVKLLRVLQEHSFERVGGVNTLQVDVRILAATHKDLEKLIELGEFRQDLYYRINVFPIESVPLRERLDDVPLLAAHFLAKTCRRLNIPDLRLTRGDVERLTGYDWPGNVRELENVIERAAILARGGRLRFDLEPSAALHAGPAAAPAAPALAGDEDELLTEAGRRDRDRRMIEAALSRCGGRVYGPNGAAALLGLPATTLASRIRALGLEPRRYRAGQA